MDLSGLSQINWLVGWLVGWLAGWLVDWLIDWGWNSRRKNLFSTKTWLTSYDSCILSQRHFTNTCNLHNSNNSIKAHYTCC